MIQWTITKMSLKVYTLDRATGKSLKLLLELEDIITTFDWQPIYLQLKNKITTATICHFTRYATFSFKHRIRYQNGFVLDQNNIIELFTSVKGFVFIRSCMTFSGIEFDTFCPNLSILPCLSLCFLEHRELNDEKWTLGDYAGLIMLGRESTSEKSENTGFLSVTYTKAQSGNVHTRWGAQKHQKLQKVRVR